MSQQPLVFHSIEAVEAALSEFVPAVKDVTGKDITLQRMKPMMAALGNPQAKLKVIHVAGTSGKTSTAYYIARMLEGEGRKIGLTVSPHIDSVTERIQIDLQPLDEWAFGAALSEFLKLVREVTPQPTYFELLVAFAYWYFAKVGVDIAVVETGLGGLHDGTNIADRKDKVCVITDIGLDHTKVLGDKSELVAAQKAGIIHPGNVALTYRQGKEINEAFKKHAEAVGTQITFCEQEKLASKYGDQLSELPNFQQRNWLLAREVCDVVAKRENFSLGEASIKASLRLQIPGRMDTQQLGGKKLVMDGAHNEQKMRAFVQSFQQRFPGKKVPVLLSLKQGKEFRSVLPLLTEVSNSVVITSFDAMRDLPTLAMSVGELADAARDAGFRHVYAIPDATVALQKLLTLTHDMAIITGSFYLIALVRGYMKQRTIRAIIAIDEKRGLANEQGIPWNLPSDRAYVRDKTYGSNLLMGYGTYVEFARPLPGRKNLVVTDGREPLREGFEAVTDLKDFMDDPPENLWVFGGAGVFKQAMDYLDEIYITQLEGDFNCTKFFPEYKDEFELVRESPPQLENGIHFTYQIWKRKD